MHQKQQIALFEQFTGQTTPPKRRKKPAAAVVQVPESVKLAKLKEREQALLGCLLDTIGLASEYVLAGNWSKFLKRTNLNLEWHGLEKILLRNNDFVPMTNSLKKPSPAVLKLLELMAENKVLNIPLEEATNIYLSMQESVARPQLEPVELVRFKSSEQ